MAKSTHSNKFEAIMTRIQKLGKLELQRQSNWTLATFREIKTRQTLGTRCAAKVKSHSKKASRKSKETLRKIISWAWIWSLLISLHLVSLLKTQCCFISRALRSSLLSTLSMLANQGHQALQNRQILTRENRKWHNLTISTQLPNRIINLTELMAKRLLKQQINFVDWSELI